MLEFEMSEPAPMPVLEFPIELLPKAGTVSGVSRTVLSGRELWPRPRLLSLLFLLATRQPFISILN
jgi:hypothetical protein